MGLTVRTVSEERELKEKIEQFPVVEGLRKYAPEQVLLIGRPGSGKSTALLRLLLEETRKPPVERLARIPVLVELRYYQTDFLDLIRDFCKRHGTLLTREDVERLLFEKQLFLLVDGLNELPSEAARRDVMAFRQTYPTTPMIFTTRDLGVGGDLNIAKKLTMQPLTEPQMQEFVRGYLGDGRMLAQLGPRLREFGQTPLLLWMLCSVFAENENHIPANLGSVFRCFCELYAHQLKQDVPAAEESPEWWQPMLQQLAWVMTRGESATEIQVAISRQKAEAVLAEFLAGKVAHPADCARRWLKDLLKYHLLQLGTGNQIEFRHQLIQEYYAAESLLQRLPSLGRDELKWEYLNYLKWTEPLALMLELVEEEALAVQVVQWGLEMDWALGARLAGAVQPQWQEQTVGLVSGLNLPQFYIVELLGKIGSEAAIPPLVKALEHSNSDVRSSAVSALAQIGSEAAIPGLLQALEHSDSDVRSSAANALGQISSEAAIPGLLQALKDFYWTVRHSAANALGQIGSEAAIPGLLQALKDSDWDVRRSVASALAQIGSEAAIPGLTQALEDPNLYVRRSVASALGQIGLETAIPGLTQALEDPNLYVRRIAVSVLAQIGSEAAIPGLLQALKDSDWDVRRSVASALAQIGSEAAIPGLTQALADPNLYVRRSAADSLGQIGLEAAIPGLIQALEDREFYVRRNSAFALGEIGSKAATFGLIQALEDREFYIRINAAFALGKIGSKAAIPGLIQALKDSKMSVRISATHILSEMDSDAAIPGLIQALKDPKTSVRRSAADGLGKIGSEAAIPGLLQALKDDDWTVRRRAVNALGKMESKVAISGLNKALKHSYSYVRWSAANALVKIGSKAAYFCLKSALKDSALYVRSSAAFALGEMGLEVAIPDLIQTLKSPASYVRLSATDALGKIGAEAAIPGLMQALKDSDSYIRSSATDALGKIGSEAAIPGLMQALKDSDSYIRNNAAFALNRMGLDAAIPGLMQALEDSSLYIRKNAAYVLGEMGLDSATLGLIQALEDSSLDVRRSASSALVKISSERVLFELRQHLKKPDVVQFNNGDTFRNAIRTLKTVQKKPKYYQPLPKYMMSNSLSHHYALLIGIGNCKDPKCSLPVTVKDIQALQSLLTDANRCGYINDTEHLRSLHDSAATKEGILNGLNWLKQQTANDPEATVIIYYSGHGWLDNTTKKYYLIPHDVKPHKISSSALSADTFNQALQKIQAQKVLVIIDSCHAQGMADAKDEPLEMPDGFAATALPKSLADTLSQGEGRAVFTSSKGNQQSWIRPDNSLSIFTDHFLQALQGAGNRPGDKAVMVSDLMNYVGKAVPESAQTDYQAEQIPFFKFETEDFPVALLRGGKGLPQEGWEGVKAQAEEKIQKIGGDVSNTVTGNVGNVVNINAEKVQVGDISSGKG